jgi:sigma-B regulation protein RsbQ
MVMTSSVMQQRLGATLTGAGERTVVFANGLGTSQHTWRHVVDGLQSQARMLRFDNVCSPVAPPGGYRAEAYGTLFAYVDDLVALLDELDVRNAILVGHSISGIIGLLAAVAAPERISSLVVLCSTPRFLEDVDFRAGFPRQQIDDILAAAQQDYGAWAASFARMVIGTSASTADYEEFRDLLAAMRPDIALRTLQTVFLGDYRAVLRRVTQPVLVLHSHLDRAVPASSGEYLVQQLPHATLVPLFADGHVPQLTAPHDVVSAISRLLVEP